MFIYYVQELATRVDCGEVLHGQRNLNIEGAPVKVRWNAR